MMRTGRTTVFGRHALMSRMNGIAVIATIPKMSEAQIGQKSMMSASATPTAMTAYVTIFQKSASFPRLPSAHS